MEKISVHEILLKHGKWIGSSEFISLVAEARNVGPRQAYNLVKKAYDGKKIKKHIFPDGTVIYGLVEFGPPSWQPPSPIQDENHEIAIVGPERTVSSREKKLDTT